MIRVLSRAQMRAFDALAIGRSVPSILLMENAGRGAADVIERELLGARARGRRVVVVCGTGNNGGDGFVVARHLLTRGALVDAYLVGDPAKRTTDCRVNHEAFVGSGGRVAHAPPDAQALTGADVVIDALFGTGLDRPIAPPLSDVIEVINAARKHGACVAALDVPSGLHSDTGAPLGHCVEADLTVTFAHLKLGLVTGQGARMSGPVHVVDIGVPPSLSLERSAELVEADDVRSHIDARPIDTHKYRAGHVAIFAGSPGRTGAALLAARGALRGGAGAATVVTWPDAASVLEARVPEVMVVGLPQADVVAASGRDELLRSVDGRLAGKAAVVIGPGFGTDAGALAVSRHVLAAFAGPIVADADALTLHAGSPEDFAVAGGRVVLTPHSGELGRLLGRSSSEIEGDRFESAREAARRSGSVVLLKGAYTIVAAPDGRVVVTGSGSPALATAGSGDVLSGLVGALACTLPTFEAAFCGAFLHGVSGRAWQKEHGDRGLLAGEIADGVPGVLAALLAET